MSTGVVAETTRIVIAFGYAASAKLFLNTKDKVTESLDGRPFINTMINRPSLSKVAFSVDISQIAKQRNKIEN
ncbi:MAG: hypothetical protein HQL94_01510 [Magnetococcales bacterium]|nr:hypothetical protein [Magnetococcales bacterium]MBF0439570.1 hypothetical protein [Magnetococcales bacterium]